ncbi:MULTISPECIES: hypothetical protein [Denitromonas]|uniref:Copper resistance protein CopC n=2 Tax=Denitromonas TaxID=139331 RepID=A0A558EJ04_9RHOO|nr:MULTISPECIES: hypothetical protein [Denitromonas]TVO59705.1 hypothetical protein FHP91_00330 [Denitromonas halophila]TVO59972.1 hypothetical protein FHP90_19040 [Denitromonas ohlonensis]TVO75062.1 hypothetical protein FHP89_14780 [Denitromonas ohlonensis]TVT49073.1 MAG: hypothetical protein FHP94_08220 [Denitromonas halophila]TVT69201.1 MAG: hypothetical protein FHP92_19720 [Denitromonas halophila]
MKALSSVMAWCIAALLSSASPHTLAGEGHDHGETPAPAAGPALPRFTAASELFELVGIVNGKRITLYLDRFDDNSPVEGASLALELGGVSIPVENHAVGEFEATLQQELDSGVVAVTATVIAGQESDLLVGELDLHDDDASTLAVADAPEWKAYAPWLGAGVAAIGLIGWAAQRKGSVRNGQAGGAA